MIPYCIRRDHEATYQIPIGTCSNAQNTSGVLAVNASDNALFTLLAFRITGADIPIKIGVIKQRHTSA